jgi:hypothetical protein
MRKPPRKTKYFIYWNDKYIGESNIDYFKELNSNLGLDIYSVEFSTIFSLPKSLYNDAEGNIKIYHNIDKCYNMIMDVVIFDIEVDIIAGFKGWFYKISFCENNIEKPINNSEKLIYEKIQKSYNQTNNYLRKIILD